MREPWATLDAADIDEDLDPDHVRLAAALCSLPFVPYPLLRAVRKYVCPAVSERLFCESPLVDGVAVDGISLDPVTRERLCRHARDRYAWVAGGPDAVALETLRAILDAHARELSPLLAIEERMLWAWLTIGDGDEFRRACDSCLRDVIGTAVLQERRTKIYRWASAAARRLPVECFHSALGWLLGQLCDKRNIRFPPIEPPSDAFGGPGPLHALAVGLPDRPLGLHRDGEYLELGPINGTRHVAVLVADTDPIPVRVEAIGEETKMTNGMAVPSPPRGPASRRTRRGDAHGPARPHLPAGGLRRRRGTGDGTGAHGARERDRVPEGEGAGSLHRPTGGANRVRGVAHRRRMRRTVAGEGPAAPAGRRGTWHHHRCRRRAAARIPAAPARGNRS